MGEVNYIVDTRDHKKRKQLFYVNMLCVDYQCLNGLLEGDAYPMPRVDELIKQVGRPNSSQHWTLLVVIGRFQLPRMADPRQYL